MNVAEDQQKEPEDTVEQDSAATDKAVDDQPDVQSAEEAVQRAREELQRAEEYCQQVRQKAAEQVERMRETTVGDVIDGGLSFAKKHPGISVAGAAVVGFFLGRLFRR